MRNSADDLGCAAIFNCTCGPHAATGRNAGVGRSKTKAGQRDPAKARTSAMRARQQASDDCTGNHEMMAKQVRPWLTQPVTGGAHRSAIARLGVSQQIPSGTSAARLNQSPNVRLQSFPSSHHELSAWQTGGVHVRMDGPKGRMRGSVTPCKPTNPAFRPVASWRVTKVATLRSPHGWPEGPNAGIDHAWQTDQYRIPACGLMAGYEGRHTP